jgi:hypothetical protein
MSETSSLNEPSEATWVVLEHRDQGDQKADKKLPKYYPNSCQVKEGQKYLQQTSI